MCLLYFHAALLSLATFFLYLRLFNNKTSSPTPSTPPKMMQTLMNSHNTARTAEIMARYRPIAPKPDLKVTAVPEVSREGDNSMPQIVQNSPYLMNVWPQLQARPSRTRKRGRSSFAPAPSVKRPRRTCLQGLSPPYQVRVSTAKPLPNWQGFVHDPNGIPQLTFFPNFLAVNCGMESNFIHCAPVTAPGAETLKELDFMPKIQGPAKSSTMVNVISPLPVRPVGSSITVERIGEGSVTVTVGKQVMKKSEEVEKEMESETFPVVVSDSNNKVRFTNSAYNEMVGQPKCCWLDCMSCGGDVGGSGGNIVNKRIGGEVLIEFPDREVPLSSKGFTCWVRIEWGNDGNKRVVNKFCDAIRLACDSKDYVFEWRFHPSETSVCNSRYLSL